MFTIQPNNSFEKYLCDRAFELETPISGTFELLPICNMDCRMCYIRLSKAQMERIGSPLKLSEWLRIGREAVSVGCVFLLLTGGEPLLYPHFRELYKALLEMGIILTINTNGTLIDSSLVKLFKNSSPRRINISLYGSSDKMYADICRNSKGFTEVSKNIQSLLDAGVPVKVNFTVTPHNRNDMENVIRLTEEWGVPISVANYMFPPTRRLEGNNSFCRLSPHEAACIQLDITNRLYRQEADYKEKIKNMLNERALSSSELIDPPGGLLCSAGVSSFWVNWKGDLTPCGMLQQPTLNLQNCSFEEGWNSIKDKCKQIFTSKKCFNCRFRKVCQGCGAASFAEHGDFSRPAAYHCELNEEYERILKQHFLELENQENYENQ